MPRRPAHPRRPTPEPSPPGKRPFDIDLVLRRIAAAVHPFRPAALFELADAGFNSLFEQLVACIISIRTFDEVTVPTARRLFELARTPEQVAALTAAEIDRRIGACTFHEPKSRHIHQIASRILSEFGGQLPCDREVLLSFAGVGPKCANLALGIACAQPWIAVDIHVHRVTNRWGYVRAATPERTMQQLEQVLPRAHHVEINRLLVPFGKHICTGSAPDAPPAPCSTCVARWAWTATADSFPERVGRLRLGRLQEPVRLLLADLLHLRDRPFGGR